MPTAQEHHGEIRASSGVKIDREHSVATGPPSRWTMLMAVVATGMASFEIDEYAAAIDGMLIAPSPTPLTKRAAHISHPGL
jgi:hypothetical protein